MKKTIRICETCGTPLIWTFAFDYCERYCLNCGDKGGMLGFGEDVDSTKELVFKQKIVNAVWKIIYSRKGMIPFSCRFKNCKKCEENEYHYEHLTKTEKEWDEIARKYLDKFIGLFDEK